MSGRLHGPHRVVGGHRCRRGRRILHRPGPRRRLRPPRARSPADARRVPAPLHRRPHAVRRAPAALVRALRAARPRRVVDRIPLALGVPVGGDAAPGAGPHLQRGDHAALDRRLLQLRLPARPRLRRPTTARRRRLRAGTGRVLGGLLLRRSPRRRAGLAVAGPDVAALEAFVLDFPPAMRVLVVEDETDLGEVFRDFLSELGPQPVLVRSAEAALGKLQTDRPDAIILDIHLPGMSGLDFLQLRPVRESGLPIVAVSGGATERPARECLRLRALDFVGKPVPLERLHDVLIFLEPHAIDRTREESTRRAERRQSPRTRIEVPVTLREYRGASWSGRCVELSATGMKVKTEATLSAGLAIKCLFTDRKSTRLNSSHVAISYA